MDLREEYWRFAMPEAQKALAERFGIYWHETEQDWHLIVSGKGWIPQFMKVYKLEDLNDDKKFALMELIITSFDDLADGESLEENEYWIECERILRVEFWLHITTIHYWSCLDKPNVEECWSITKYIRPIWEDVKSNFI